MRKYIEMKKIKNILMLIERVFILLAVRYLQRLWFRSPCFVSIFLLIYFQLSHNKRQVAVTGMYKHRYLTELIAFSAEINIISHTIVI